MYLYMFSASSMLQHLVHNSVHGAAAAREALVAQSKAHLDLLEGQRKLFLRSRALSLAQRALLYAHDELDMSMMRMQLRSAHDAVKPHEQHFRLQPFEVPLKNRVSPLHAALSSGKRPVRRFYVAHCMSIPAAMRQHLHTTSVKLVCYSAGLLYTGQT